MLAAPPRRRQPFQVSLMASASGLAILLAQGGLPAQASTFHSLNQALAAAAKVATAGVGTSGIAASKQAAIGVANLQAATARFRSLSASLAQAAAAAPAGNVPNGIGPGGLNPAAGYNIPGSQDVWIGVNTAQPYKETTSGGQTNVTVTQTAPQAVLNWRSFNVGSHTKVIFDQSAGKAGASTWSVLNRIENNTISPTQIFGSISAQGQVLVLDTNGVLFAPGSQVSLHSLVAGGVAITNKQYLSSGIYSANLQSVLQPAFTDGYGAVTVQAGATISIVPTGNVTSGAGSVILLGGAATNNGYINTPAGQTILAAGLNFIVAPGLSAAQSASGTVSGNTNSTVLGSEVLPAGPGIVTNNGLITAETGDITLAGETVRQNGVLLSTTSVNQRGTIHLLNDLYTNVPAPGGSIQVADRNGSITLAPGSVTAILPDSSGTTASNAMQESRYALQPATSASTDLGNLTALPDRAGLSRIEITGSGNINFAANSLTLAPGGQIAVGGYYTDSATSQPVSTAHILVASGAQLDVSGLTNVLAAASENNLAISIEQSNLLDSPLNNSLTGVLNSNTVYVDTRDVTVVAAGADTAVRDYTAGGLLQVSGELGNQGHTESEWSTVAGQIMLYAAQVVAQRGAVFNLAGGSLKYQAGYLQQSYVQSVDGTIYNVNAAPGNLQYVGVYKGVVVDHPRWHLTDIYNNPLLTPSQTYQPGYTVGRDGGSLVLNAPTVLLNATVNAGVVNSSSQTAAPATGSADPFQDSQRDAPSAAGLTLADEIPKSTGFFPTRVAIVAGGSPAAAVPTDTAILDANQLSGLGTLTIAVGNPTATVAEPAIDGSIAVESALTLAPGGRVSLTAPNIDVQAAITAPSGSISIAVGASLNSALQGSVAVQPGVALSTAGLITAYDPSPTAASFTGYVNGGSVSIESTGALSLLAGSSIDVSSGAAFGASGFVGGSGGNVSIAADDSALAGLKSTNPIALFGREKPVVLNSWIAGYGVSGGGTLSLSVPLVLIGDPAQRVPGDAVDLTPGFFTHGFTAYTIDGFAPPTYTQLASGVTVQAGTQLAPVVPVLVQAGSSAAPALQPELPPEYLFNAGTDTLTHRVGASLTLDAINSTSTIPGGTVSVGEGASITVDQGQNVTLATAGTIIEDGAIHAPSGTITLANLATTQFIDANVASHLAVWVGSRAVLDVAGRAEIAAGPDGRRFGVVPNGGAILLGGAGNFANISQNPANAPAAFVFVRPGALLDASGTSGELTLSPPHAQGNLAAPASNLVQVDSAGGTVTAVSGDGIYLDGTIQAASGGPTGAGGTLRIQLDTDQYDNTGTLKVPAWAITPHRIVVSDSTQATPLPANLRPGDNSFLNRPGVAGQAAISVAQIDQGGFANLALLSRDQITFAGNVDLKLSQSVTLAADTIDDASLNATVNVAAPYVLLEGVFPVGQLGPNTSGVSPQLGVSGATLASKAHLPCFTGAALCTHSSFAVDAGQIDIQNNVAFGVTATITDNDLPFGAAPLTQKLDVPGFDSVALNSSGDIRFAADNQPTGQSGGPASTLIGLNLDAVSVTTQGNLSLSARRIYPETGVAAQIFAGQNIFDTKVPGGSTTASYPGLTRKYVYFNRSTIAVTQTGTAGVAPYSAFGSLTLVSDNIDQGGSLFAPLGALVLDAGDVLTLRTGSTTSISANGLQIPFGGTSDGLTYAYDGTVLTRTVASYGAATNPGQTNNNPTEQNIQLDFNKGVVETAALLDLSGGGTLAGAGFVPGSGGSVNILDAATITFNATAHTASQPAASTTTNSGVGVYAILPGLQSSYAPGSLLDKSGAAAGSEPAVGEQVTIGAGVPRLAAGTYTLLPATYALLPGAYRVQFNQGSTTNALTQPRLADGISTLADGRIGIAGTSVLSALPTLLTITPQASVPRYAQYDRQDFASFAIAQSALFSTPRPYLPQDAGALTIEVGHSFSFAGIDDFQPAQGGYDGTVALLPQPATTFPPPAGSQTLQIVSGTALPPPRANYITDSTIDALHAPLLEIGGYFGAQLVQTGDVEYPTISAIDVSVGKGATLTAGAIWLFASGQVTIAPGAELSTLGRKLNLPDSSTGVVFTSGQPNPPQNPALSTTVSDAVLGVANGNYVSYAPSGGVGNVLIGSALPGAAPVQLYSDGFVGVFGGGSIAIAANTRIGAPTFELAEPAINVGTIPKGAASLSGFDFTQATLSQILAGNPAAGVPAVTTLDLAAGDSVNFYGNVSLNGINASGQSDLTLELTTPAIYGYGSAGQTATVNVADFIWTGASNGPGPVLAHGAGTGSGTLAIDARQIVFGYGQNAQAQDQTSLSHLILGFGAVNLTATDFLSANNHASLSVYQAQGAYSAATGYSYSGGKLTIDTPLTTTTAGAVLAITSGGPVTLNALPAAAGGAALPGGLGGEIDITAPTITDATATSLPGGQFVLTSTGDITLAAGAAIDLAGGATQFFDVRQYGWGGNLHLTGANVTEAAGARIDISAQQNNAGNIDISTPGSVSLLGTLAGSAMAGYGSGSIRIRAGSLGDLAALDKSLDMGGIFGSRHFEQTGAGDLTVGSELVAHSIFVAADQGSLTVDGTLDASGAAPGTISLAGGQGLTLTQAAVLDAHGTRLQTDSSGAPIDAENTASIALTSLGGTLTIEAGARIDVRSADGVARGDVELNVQRGAQAGTAAVSANGSIAVLGAQTIAVNAFRTYTPDNSPGLLAGGVITQASLDGFDADSRAFITGAIANGLAGKALAGLAGYSQAFHLRPGVQIESSADVAGNSLSVGGDLDFSGERYASLNPNSQVTGIHGSGEPGVLWVRAGYNLNIYGSINDGFAPPPRTPDDNGWVLPSGVIAAGNNLVLPVALTLAGAAGPNGATTYPVGNYTLSYAVTIANGATLAAGSPAPVAVSLTADVTVQSSFVLNGRLSGSVRFRPGQVVPAGTVLAAGTILAAGTKLPLNVAVGGVGSHAGITLPPGTNFAIFADSSETIQSNLRLQAGDLIPAGASLQFTGQGQTSVDLRPSQTVGTASIQGQLWAVAPLLPTGDLSWSLRLVSGADLAAADSTSVQAPAALGAVAKAGMQTGSLVLSDLHFANAAADPNVATPSANVDFSVVRTGTGSLDLISGGNIEEDTLFGVYTAGTQSGGITAGGVFDAARPTYGGSVLGTLGDTPDANGATYNSAVQNYQAYYPHGGGNLVLSAQGDIAGNVNYAMLPDEGIGVSGFSNTTSKWLWWQAGKTTPSAWWINFGTFIDEATDPSGGTSVQLAGFTGFGTLGGGNLTVTAGGNIGAPAGADAGNSNTPGATTAALDLTVASTGRTNAGATSVALAGGGRLDVSAGGSINPGEGYVFNPQFDGTVTDLRGDVHIAAGAIGTVVQTYQDQTMQGDPRPFDPFHSLSFQAYGGQIISLGDASASVQTRGDLALAGIGDPTIQLQYQFLPMTTTGAVGSAFTLWQSGTTVSLDSLGGNVAPFNPAFAQNLFSGDPNAQLYPPNLDVAAFSGNIEIEAAQATPLELAPAPRGQLQLLAGSDVDDSFGQSLPFNGSQTISFVPVAVDISGASTASGNIATPLSPFYGQTNVTTNLGLTYFINGDTASGIEHVGDTTPARFYAVAGDINGLITGQTLNNGSEVMTLAGKAVDVQAGRDIVNFTGLVLNNNATDISTLQAGRDIIYANEQIAGPGLLEVQAGGNVVESANSSGNNNAIVSLGEIGMALTPATRDNGAGILVLAGVGTGYDPTAFANLYLNQANLADPATPLQNQPGRVERTYQQQLLQFLQSDFGYTGTQAGALAFFATLPQAQQTAFLLRIYFAELNLSGLDYNNPASRFYHSYLEGQEAIKTLFPATDSTGKSAPAGGNLTLGANGQITTMFGGGITTVVPYGATTLGAVQNTAPPEAGLVTQGSGDINIYSYGSVILGQSKVLTTFGGNILIWLSSDGQINAGVGSKSTVLSAPIGISYDNYGNIVLSPTVPTTGGGIGTISPIAQVPPGNVNLVAPVGTVNAGEAGIRASGNANIAALTVLNGSNIQVAGKTSGVPTASAPSVSAEAAASASAGASTIANQQATARPPAQTPSVIEVEVTISGSASDDEDQRRRKHPAR